MQMSVRRPARQRAMCFGGLGTPPERTTVLQAEDEELEAERARLRGGIATGLGGRGRRPARQRRPHPAGHSRRTFEFVTSEAFCTKRRTTRFKLIYSKHTRNDCLTPTRPAPPPGVSSRRRPAARQRRTHPMGHSKRTYCMHVTQFRTGEALGYQSGGQPYLNSQIRNGERPAREERETQPRIGNCGD